MSKKLPNRFDDGFMAFLTEKASFSNDKIRMPEIIDMKNTDIPKALIPYDKLRTSSNKRGYIHFFVHDKVFASFIANIDRYLPILSEYDGVITPDCSLSTGQLDYLQMTNTYFNRAVGCYLQRKGFSVIPTVRWSDETSYEFCFNGLPQNSILAISTHGFIKSTLQKRMFRNGLIEMLNRLTPTDVIVHGPMPPEVFVGLDELTNFHKFPNRFESYYIKEV